MFFKIFSFFFCRQQYGPLSSSSSVSSNVTFDAKITNCKPLSTKVRILWIFLLQVSIFIFSLENYIQDPRWMILGLILTSCIYLPGHFDASVQTKFCHSFDFSCSTFSALSCGTIARCHFSPNSNMQFLEFSQKYGFRCSVIIFHTIIIRARSAYTNHIVHASKFVFTCENKSKVFLAPLIYYYCLRMCVGVSVCMGEINLGLFFFYFCSCVSTGMCEDALDAFSHWCMLVRSLLEH